MEFGRDLLIILKVFSLVFITFIAAPSCRSRQVTGLYKTFLGNKVFTRFELVFGMVVSRKCPQKEASGKCDCQITSVIFFQFRLYVIRLVTCLSFVMVIGTGLVLGIEC